MKKKLFSLLVLTSIIMYASLSIALAVTKRNDDYVYEIKGAGIRIVQYIGSEKETLAVPGTIDNYIACTEYTIVYDTAINTAVEMIDKLRDTIQSHARCSVVEVMGHKVGFLAQSIGIACGALMTLVPEVKYDLDRDVVERILYTQRSGKTHFIIVMAEGCGSSQDVADFIQTRTGIETRVTVLGHVQRGGIPTARDRVMATEMGYKAVELLEDGKGSRVVVFKHGEIMDLDIEEALAMNRTLDLSKFEMTKMISL